MVVVPPCPPLAPRITAPGRGEMPIFLAERVRFELTIGLPRLRFSRPVQSTALPPLRSGEFDHSFSFYQAAGSVLHPGAPPAAVLAAVFSGIAFSPTAAGPGDRTTAGRTLDQRESAAAADHLRTRRRRQPRTQHP